MNICSQHCIEIKKDKYGEIHPFIDELKCVTCKRCVNICPINNKPKLNEPEKVYASWRTDKKQRRDSASGGIAALLSEKWIAGGGIVYGTKFDENFNAVICKGTTAEEIKAFKGSKYVQSYAGNTYDEVKKLLIKGEKILFFGTPCQIAGLYAVTNGSQPNLFTVEILCHGVCPESYLQEQLQYVNQKVKKSYNKLTFRTNRNGMQYCFCLWNNNNIVYCQQAAENEYFKGFISGLTLRESCYQCNYKSTARLGDLCIGDFIGYGKHIPAEPRGGG